MNKELNDDMLKLVRYKVLFVRREYEHAFPEREDLVPDNMDGSSFTAWKTAEFIQELGRKETKVPEKWINKKYPPDKFLDKDRIYLIGLPDEDKKYLRIYYEVLDRYPREKFKHEEQQIRVLEQIRDSLKEAKTVPLTDPYDELRHRLQLSSVASGKLREDFKRCADEFGKDVAEAFNRYREIGHLHAPAVNADELAAAFKGDAFNRRSFDMFTGPALGDLRIYRHLGANPVPKEIRAPSVHSIWGPVQEKNGEFIQRITGSNHRYVSPDDLEEISALMAEVKVDLTFNAYTKELGIVSWAAFYQNHSNQMRSIGFEMGDKLVWINQLLDPDMTPTFGPLSIGDLEGGPVDIHKDQYVVSVDYASAVNGKRYFNVYAMHIDFDFANCSAKFAGPILKMLNEVVSL